MKIPKMLREATILVLLGLLGLPVLGQPPRAPIPPGGARIPFTMELPEDWDGGELFLTMTKEPGTERAQTSRQPMPMFETSVLNTAAGTSLLLEFEATDLWSPPILLVAETREEPLVARFYATGTVEGRLALPQPIEEGDELPGEVELRIETSSKVEARGSEGEPPILRSAIRCPIEEDRFSCRLPAARLDLRILASGFAPHYRWDIEIEKGETLALGTLQLARGGSIIGWIEAPPEELDEESATVEIEVSHASVENRRSERKQITRRTLETESEPSGFFQLTGVQPGEYRLVASHAQSGTATAFPVRVAEGRESELPHPVRLQPPAPLAVNVHPAIDPRGNPWQVRVMEFNRTRTAVRSQVVGKVDENGSWTSKLLTAGPYMVTLVAADGTKWDWREVEVAGLPEEVDFFLDLLEVEGRLLLGEEGIAGSVWFGGRRGGTSIRMQSDEEGRFTGLLPRPGSWRVDVRTDEPVVEKRLRMEVDEAEGDRIAQVEIRLGAGEVYGEVVNADGEPVAGAMVWLSELYEGAAGPRMATSEEDGAFQFAGVEEGEHYLRAYLLTQQRRQTSGEVPVEISEDGEPAPVQLRLEDQRQLRGVVVSGAGPVPGANLIARVEAAGGAIVPQATTDVEGRFSLDLPTRDDEVQLTILPPGFAMACMRFITAGDEEVVVPVQGAGGTLRIRGTELGEQRTFHGLSLSQDGVPCSPGSLALWGRSYGQLGEESMISQLSAGYYEACWSGAGADSRNVEDRQCQDGWLSPGGELVLDFGGHLSQKN